MGNIREINRVSRKYDIPLIFDVARWAGTPTSSR